MVPIMALKTFTVGSGADAAGVVGSGGSDSGGSAVMGCDRRETQNGRDLGRRGRSCGLKASYLQPFCGSPLQ